MSDQPIRVDGVRERAVGGETMLYNAAGRAVHVLNRTADFVWRSCDGSRSPAQIAAAAEEAFDGSADAIRADVEACLAALREKGLVRSR